MLNWEKLKFSKSGKLKYGKKINWLIINSEHGLNGFWPKAMIFKMKLLGYWSFISDHPRIDSCSNITFKILTSSTFCLQTLHFSINSNKLVSLKTLTTQNLDSNTSSSPFSKLTINHCSSNPPTPPSSLKTVSYNWVFLSSKPSVNSSA